MFVFPGFIISYKFSGTVEIHQIIRIAVHEISDTESSGEAKKMRNHIRKPECKISGMISAKTGSCNCYSMSLVKLLDIRHKFFNEKLYIPFVVSYSLLGRNFIIVKTPAVDGLYVIKLYFSLFYEPIDASIEMKIMVLGVLSLGSREHDDRMAIMPGHFYLETCSQYI
jgi:hypothetical protein